MVSDLSKIYGNVQLGENVLIEEFCVIGKPPRGFSDGELKTIIGDNSTIRSGTVIYAGNVIGKKFNTGHNVVIREENLIGDDVSVGTLSCIEHHIEIEDGVRMHSQVFIPEFSCLKAKSWIGPNVVITNAKYPQGKGVSEKLKGVVVEEGAIVGANVTTLPGVIIGKNALVGSGSLVAKDVAEEAVVVGNPARVINSVSNIIDYTDK